MDRTLYIQFTAIHADLEISGLDNGETKVLTFFFLLFLSSNAAGIDDIDYTQIPVSALMIDTGDMAGSDDKIASSLEQEIASLSTRYDPPFMSF